MKHFLMITKKGEHTHTKKMVEIFHQFFFPDPESNDVVHTNTQTEVHQVCYERFVIKNRCK